jgi:DedD protein
VENSLKQRLIGAVVLAALAIIFLPAILKEKSSNGTFQSQIPSKPSELEEYRIDADKIDKLIAKKNAKSEASELASAEEQNQAVEAINRSKLPTDNAKAKLAIAKQAKKTKDITEQPASDSSVGSDKVAAEKQRINDDFVDGAWVVQVASFSNQTNADKLIATLKASKLKAYSRPKKHSSGIIYRVLVGPYVDKAVASKAVSKISEISETSALLKVFDPLVH